MNANDFAREIGEFALRLMFDHGSRAMYVVYVADAIDDNGTFGNGAVISNLERPADVKEALYHAAREYKLDGAIEYVDTELPQ